MNAETVHISIDDSRFSELCYLLIVDRLSMVTPQVFQKNRIIV